MPTPQHNRSPFALAREPQPSFPQIPALGDPSAGGSAIPLLDIGRLAGLLLRRWWVIALCAGFFTALALAYVLTAAKRYQSNAAIYVGREPERILKGVTDVTQKDLKELEELKTVEQILGSTTLILQAVEANGLRDDPSFAPPKPDGSAYSDAEMVGIFSEHYGAALRRGTRLIDIWFEDTDAERAQRIAASMFDVFREHTRGQAQTANQRAKEALEAKRIELATELDEAEHDMLDYRARHADLPLDEDQNVIEQRLRDLEGELTKATAERLRLESDIEKIAQIGPGQPEAILRLGSVSQLDEVSELVRAINLKEAEFARLSERYGPLWPAIIQAQSELDELRARLRQTAFDVAENFAQRYAAARQNEAKLEQQVKEQRATVLRLAEARLGFADLERDVSLSREQYQNVADRLKELETVSGISDSEIHLAEEPLVASRPSWPPKKIIVGLAFIFGCSLGAALIIGADLAGGALQTAAQAEKALGIPSLASIPEAGIASLEQGLIMRGDRNSPAAEAFRSLRTSLSFINQGGSARSYLFTSPSEDNGKTFCAMNFATALAFQGYRTLLIDADLRKPSLSRVFLHETGTIGLTDHLEGRVEPSQACFETDVENLYLFCAGSPAQNPAELLADVRFGALLHESYKWFDKVIIDSSAVGRVSDALSLAQHAESTVLIIRAGRTRRADAARASRLLAMAGAPPVGFIMNGTEAPNDRPAFRFADRQRPAPVLHAAPRFLGMAGGRDPELSHN